MASITKRKGKYFVQVRRNGHSISKTFTLKKDAETWGRQKELELERGDLPTDPRKKLQGVTLGHLIERYRDSVSLRKKSAKNEQIALNAFLRHEIARKQVVDVTAGDFATYRDERLETVAPTTLKRELTIIQNVYKVAKDEWGMPLKHDPVKDLGFSASLVRRDRRLQEGELELIIEEAKVRKNPLVLPVILFAIELGMRRSEILRMQWKHLDLKNRVLLIPETKNGHPRKIPLTNKALDILEGIDPISERVFAISPNAIKLAWQRMAKKIGLDDLHFHDFRHEAVSTFFEKGLAIQEVATISGHRDWRSLKIYTQPKPENILKKLAAA